MNPIHMERWVLHSAEDPKWLSQQPVLDTKNSQGIRDASFHSQPSLEKQRQSQGSVRKYAFYLYVFF